jgi:hypothetical protein
MSWAPPGTAEVQRHAQAEWNRAMNRQRLCSRSSAVGAFFSIAVKYSFNNESSPVKYNIPVKMSVNNGTTLGSSGGIPLLTPLYSVHIRAPTRDFQINGLICRKR